MITQADLRQFTGTENWYRHGLLRRITFTDGVKYLAEHAQCWWLIDDIAIMQLRPEVRAVDFQFWKLKVEPDGTALLTMVKDEGYEPTYTQKISITDFPMPEVEIWFRDNVIFLPSEY
jgi:hypothetical protein